MSETEKTALAKPDETKKSPYRVPEGEGFLAPREPVGGSTPPSEPSSGDPSTPEPEHQGEAER